MNQYLFLLFLFPFMIADCPGMPGAAEASQDSIASWPDARKEGEKWLSDVEEKGGLPSHKLCLLVDSLKALEKGANVKGKDGRLALVTAAGLGRRDIFEFLVRQGAESGKDKQLDALFVQAVCGGCLPVVEWLFLRGADVNAAGSMGSTPLMLAACRNNRAMVEFLLARTANPDAANDDGETAADYAQRNGHEELALHLRTSMKSK